jgi:NAD(P)-dependent dehydrogenase (short-subunit alcohol dehydrogenase family)
MDCKSHGIRVNQVCPTWVRTPMFDYECERIPSVPSIIEKVVPTKRPAEPDEVASACLYFCSPSGVYVNGVALMMDSGISVGPSIL